MAELKPCPFCGGEVQVPRWISVEERMPEHGESVAAIIRYTEDAWDVVVGYVLNGEWYTAGHTPGFPITHWMPLPEPPKEGKNNGKE